MAAAAPIPAPDLLAGTWTFTRRLVDRLAGGSGTALGVLEVDASARRWCETGSLRWGGREVPVTRAMGFVRRDDEWWMTFADGRPFHPLRFDATVEHLCGADVYRGCLRLDDAGRILRVGWDVTGPAKDQRILTRYVRT